MYWSHAFFVVFATIQSIHMEMRREEKQLFLCFLFFMFVPLDAGSSSLSPGQSLSGNQTITSPDGTFQLGFFTPGESYGHFVGIWITTIPNTQTVVWVGNREEPVADPYECFLKLSADGNLVLTQHIDIYEMEMWSATSSVSGTHSTIALLLDTGNFVVRDASNESNLIWQSFDHPTDTWLPSPNIWYTHEFVHDTKTLRPWNSIEDPSPTSPNLWRSTDFWTQELSKNIARVASPPYAITRFVVNVTGQVNLFVLRNASSHWVQLWKEPEPAQRCSPWGSCGSFGVCSENNVTPCDCVLGFEPKDPWQWALQDYSAGCARKVPFQCSQKDAFSLIPFVNVWTENSYFEFDQGFKTLEQCRTGCMSDCSCIAFYLKQELCCFIYRKYGSYRLRHADDVETRLYLRFGEASKQATHGNTIYIYIIVAAVAGCVSVCGLVLIFLRKKPKVEGLEGSSLLHFNYCYLLSATEKFSHKLGQGGFGSVFKGTLPNSSVIAVKALNTNLGQGDKEFRAEVRTLGTIQHVNLVRLRGFCAESSKRFLVYDYMPNGSLESHLFRNNSNGSVLDWKTRRCIAIGTAKGLAYLHQECVDCIIHCDIKPENILLDAEYNPKVADFGLAKLLGRDFSRVLTTMRGTVGYLAPEWISGEPITAKADVFSYGMLLLEIISGRRNRDLVDGGGDNFFPFRVANTMSKGEDVMDLLDMRLERNGDAEEVSRACKVACWCIQDCEKDRPSMGLIVQVLEGTCDIPVPPIPQFLQFLAGNPAETVFYLPDPSDSDDA